MGQRPGRKCARCLLVLALACWLVAPGACQVPAAEEAQTIELARQRFVAEVDRRLDLPEDAQARVVQQLDAALSQAGLSPLPPQHVLVVDRSPQVQAAFLLLRAPQGGWHWVGASPVSTGRVGGFDHFRTPLGVFAHSLDNLDFRAEGTYNANGVRGYGARGMRVFDFGWVQAERGWGAGGQRQMRLQMHATDPTLLEPRLGRVESKGCIRIPATLNVFLDRHGVLDADYEQGLAQGKALWMLRADRTPLPWPGRWLVVVDSMTRERPPWSPLPGATAAGTRARSVSASAAAC